MRMKSVKAKNNKNNTPTGPKLSRQDEKDVSFMTKGSADEDAYKKELIEKMDAINLDYGKYHLADFNYRSRGISNPNEVSQEDAFNRLYVMNMLMQMGDSFLESRHDLNSMVACIGMYMAFACTSDIGRHPFRYLKKPKPIQDELYRMNPDYASQIDNAMGNDDARLPMTAECASLLYIKATQQAYDDMRKPGADAIDVKHDYDSYLKYLVSRCEQDGISKETLHRTTKQIYALFEDDNKLESRKLFEQTSGTFGVRERPYTMNVPHVDKQGKMHMESAHIHMGEYIYPDDTVSRNAKFFNIRMPKSLDDYDTLMDIDASYLYHLHKASSISGDRELQSICKDEMRNIVDNYSVMMKDDRVFMGSDSQIRGQVIDMLDEAIRDCDAEYKAMPEEQYKNWESMIEEVVDNHHTMDKYRRPVFDVDGVVDSIRNQVYDTSITIYPRLSAQAIEEMVDDRYKKRLDSKNASKDSSKSVASSRFEKFGYPTGSGMEPAPEVAATGVDVRPGKQPIESEDEESENFNAEDFDDSCFDVDDYDFC